MDERSITPVVSIPAKPPCLPLDEQLERATEVLEEREKAVDGAASEAAEARADVGVFVGKRDEIEQAVQAYASQLKSLHKKEAEALKFYSDESGYLTDVLEHCLARIDRVLDDGQIGDPHKGLPQALFDLEERVIELRISLGLTKLPGQEGYEDEAATLRRSVLAQALHERDAAQRDLSGANGIYVRWLSQLAKANQAFAKLRELELVIQAEQGAGRYAESYRVLERAYKNVAKAYDADVELIDADELREKLREAWCDVQETAKVLRGKQRALDEEERGFDGKEAALREARVRLDELRVRVIRLMRPKNGCKVTDVELRDEQERQERRSRNR